MEKNMDADNGSPLRKLILIPIFKFLRSPGIYSKESIPPAYVAWLAGITTLPARQAT